MLNREGLSELDDFNTSLIVNQLDYLTRGMKQANETRPPLNLAVDPEGEVTRLTRTTGRSLTLGRRTASTVPSSEIFPPPNLQASQRLYHSQSLKVVGPPTSSPPVKARLKAVLSRRSRKF